METPGRYFCGRNLHWLPERKALEGKIGRDTAQREARGRVSVRWFYSLSLTLSAAWLLLLLLPLPLPLLMRVLVSIWIGFFFFFFFPLVVALVSGFFWGGGDSLRKRDIGAPITAAARPRRSSTCRVWQPSQRADRTPRWSRRSSSGLSSSCSWSQEGPRSGIDRLESPAAGRRLLAY